jgi:WD40 repeat protein
VAHCVCPEGELLSVVFHPTAPRLAWSSGKGCVRIWDYARDAILLRLECNTVVYGVVFSADGRWIAGAGHDGLIYVWDAASGQRVALLSGHTHRVLALALCADRRTLISGGADQTLRAWDLPSARPLYELNGHRRSIAAMALSPAAPCLAVVGNGLAVWLWEARTGAVIGRWPAHERMITTCEFASDGQILATGGSDQTIYLWDVVSGRKLRALEGHSQPVERVVFHPTLPLLASGGLDYSVRLWDVTTGQQRAVQSLHSSWVSDLAFSPDGRWLVSSAGDETLRCWALDAAQTLQPVAVLPVPDVEKGQGIAIALHPLRPLLAYATTQHVELLSIADLRVVARFANQSSWVTGLAFSSDGARLACVGHERMLRLWDVAHGRLRWEQESPAQVNSLLFAVDGRCLFGGRADGCVDRWDVATGACVQTMCIPGPYQGMKIRAVTGITPAQRASLLDLGAVER